MFPQYYAAVGGVELCFLSSEWCVGGFASARLNKHGEEHRHGWGYSTVPVRRHLVLMFDHDITHPEILNLDYHGPGSHPTHADYAFETARGRPPSPTILARTRMRFEDDRGKGCFYRKLLIGCTVFRGQYGDLRLRAVNLACLAIVRNMGKIGPRE